jgi:hypothetical protein
MKENNEGLNKKIKKKTIKKMRIKLNKIKKLET